MGLAMTNFPKCLTNGTILRSRKDIRSHFPDTPIPPTDWPKLGIRDLDVLDRPAEVNGEVWERETIATETPQGWQWGWTSRPLTTEELADRREQTLRRIKSEANRRCLEIMPEFKQRNFLALKAECDLEYGTDPSAWPVEMQQLVVEGRAAFAQINAIRAKSDEIEAMNPAPEDVTDDALWQV